MCFDKVGVFDDDGRLIFCLDSVFMIKLRSGWSSFVNLHIWKTEIPKLFEI